MNLVIKMLKEKKKELESENEFDEQMLEEGCGTEDVQKMRRKSVSQNNKFIGQINRAIVKIISNKPDKKVNRGA